MATKGLKYDGPNDPNLPRFVQRIRDDNRRAAWVEEHNRKWAVIATCYICEPPHPLTEDELDPHKLTHVNNTRARVIIGMLMNSDEESVLEVADYLNGDN